MAAVCVCELRVGEEVRSTTTLVAKRFSKLAGEQTPVKGLNGFAEEEDARL
ncbi:uncharacterized protein G2W53_017284 [Senna tora]|uniref:Uncharacterized protein n=1 Tax=Senna tora TaxID=362788 RepID=A0A834TTK9_9FABA|nr:uncharacterized protein G2W53_017284 [Senna tora]